MGIHQTVFMKGEIIHIRSYVDDLSQIKWVAEVEFEKKPIELHLGDCEIKQ